MNKNKTSIIKCLVEGNYVEIFHEGMGYMGVFKEIYGDEEGGTIMIQTLDSPILIPFDIPHISDIKIIPSMNKKCNVIFRNQNGQELYLEITHSEGKGTLGIEITGNPENMKEHNGFHITLANILVEALSEE
ncbi:MAG: hypothetical protein H6Q12_53 [Bacteroidetes bacterium]|nr:hypothetical protein [Bacteroidota bacterium]